MKSTSSVNYKDSYFEHPVLTEIHGEPTYETLHHLKNELKVNASSVPTTLVCSNHDYLGMILTPVEYCRIVPTDPFTRPPNLGVLVPNPIGTSAQTASADNTHHLTKKTLFWDPISWTTLHPTNHQGHWHYIYRHPSHPHHRKNFTTVLTIL